MKSKAITIIIFFALGWFSYNHYLVSPESKIEALLKNASELATIHEDTNKIQRAAQAHQLSMLFTPSASFEVILNDENELYIQNRKEIKQRALSALTALKDFEVSALAKSIKVSSGKKAQASVIGSASGSLPGEKGKFLERHEFEINFILDKDNEWKIESVVHLNNLRESSEN